ncbi:glycoside hydrolase family 17 protein [Hyaloscypha bicolor E]|uniref:glucan endo-1,3-beta-D-glucosidase n=1 Tax=Hyaloscypha bicolor E TaxID=1095630 RepID=A0A2J6TMX3_9HELO|nr:glycoside hydrolase family 17 protein [Hyaloscypha bicolor E]PMD64384.1 glycoside hydrolase family 17 protein [Hyaloscypha bicolor E]
MTKSQPSNLPSSKFGTTFTNLVVGISVGSEDLYRISAAGIAAKSGLGAGAVVLVSCISQVRAVVKGTGLATVQIGHVDTVPAWATNSNSAVVSAVDWLGVDIYPYLETETELDSVDNDSGVFQDEYGPTSDVGKGKPVWVMGTGWPNSAP